MILLFHFTIHPPTHPPPFKDDEIPLRFETNSNFITITVMLSSINMNKETPDEWQGVLTCEYYVKWLVYICLLNKYIISGLLQCPSPSLNVFSGLAHTSTYNRQIL